MKNIEAYMKIAQFHNFSLCLFMLNQINSPYPSDGIMPHLASTLFGHGLLQGSALSLCQLLGDEILKDVTCVNAL